MGQTGDDDRLSAILELCYTIICEGGEPDLELLCASAPELRDRVARILERERQALRAEVLRLPARQPDLPGDVPSRIGEFVLLEPIGLGGMSVVYRARQEPLGREVAIKLLRKGPEASPAARLRFAREATITASLEHPNIVPVYAAGESDGYVYLAMKLLRGRSLDQQSLPLPPIEVARIGMEVASALEAAHQIGVIHRDLKPANIVLEDGHAVVVDFGLAAFADRASVLTQENATPGTLLYLPPETASRSTGFPDVRADIYSLGATLYELIAGHAPFDAGNPVRALQQILHEDARPLALRGRDRDLEVLIFKALEKQPGRRFQSAEEFATELWRYLRGDAIVTHPPGPIFRVWRTIRRRPAVALLSAMVCILALVLATNWELSRRAEAHEVVEKSAQVRTALQEVNLGTARILLSQLANMPGAGQQTAQLLQEWHAEYDLQAACLAVAHPVRDMRSEHLGQVMKRLRAQAATSDRMDLHAVLALEDWSRDRPSGQLNVAYPRLAAVLSVARRPELVRRALADPRTSKRSHSLDHHLTAAAMRQVGIAEPEVENELRLTLSDRRTPVLQHSLALAVEAQGRHREAYEANLGLVADPVCGSLALWALTRLAAALGDRENLELHLVAATRQSQTEDSLVDLVGLSKLQVLSHVATGSFWEQWRQAPESLKILPTYWRLAGYVEFAEASSADSLGKARDYLQKGLALEPGRNEQATLEVALLQCRLAEEADGSAAAASAGTAEPGQRLVELAEAAEQLALRLTLQQLSAQIIGDAHLVAAQCRMLLGQWHLASLAFDRAAEHGQAKCFLVYCDCVAQHVAMAILGSRRAGLIADADLDAAVPIALERARRMLASKAQDARLPAVSQAVARSTILLCAAYLGDAATALPAALAWQAEGGRLDAVVGEIANRLRNQGGVLIDRLPEEAPRAVARLDAAYASLVREVALESMPVATAREVLERLLADATVAGLTKQQSGIAWRSRCKQWLSGAGR